MTGTVKDGYWEFQTVQVLATNPRMESTWLFEGTQVLAVELHRSTAGEILWWHVLLLRPRPDVVPAR